MRINSQCNKVWCEKDRAWKKKDTEIYMPDGCDKEGRICCLKCGAVLGYTHDLEWDKLLGD